MPAAAREAGAAAERRTPTRRRVRRSARPARSIPPDRARATSARSRRWPRVTTDASSGRSDARRDAAGAATALRRARRRRSCRTARTLSGGDRARPTVRARARCSAARSTTRRASSALDAGGRAAAARAGRRACSAVTDERVQLPASATRRSRRRTTSSRSRHQQIPKVAAAAATTTGASSLRFLLRENLPGAYPVHGRRLPVQAHGRGPDAHVRGRGHARADQPALPLPVARAAGRAALDGIRLGDALRRGSARTDPTSTARSATPACPSRTLDDVKKLYSGFDLCDPTHVGVDDDQRPGADHPRDVPEHRDRPGGREVPAAGLGAMGGGRADASRAVPGDPRPRYEGALPRRQRRPGAGAARRHRRPARVEARDLRADQAPTRCARVRGTVQADILKEDQAQNTCIFSTEFALRMMGDIQQFFIDHRVRNFYSVSISGYHIAEAGANPITQLAFTLANGFTYRRVLPRARDEDRRLRAEPVVLLQQRHGPRVQRASAASPAGSGRARCASATRQRRAARS